MKSPTYIRQTVKILFRNRGISFCPRGFSGGFSLVELLVVLAVMSVLGLTAIPTMMTVVSNARLQGGGTNLSGLLQNTRMLAVKQNATMSAHFTVLGNGPVAYVKQAADGSGITGTDPQVQLGAPLTKVSTPLGAGGPTPLTTTELGFTAVETDTSFNSRGLPCAYVSGTCTSAGFVYYFKDRRPMGKTGWIAVSVSPAGRIRRWIHNGLSWGS